MTVEGKVFGGALPGASGTGTSTLALFPFQREIVEWALDKERAAVFADTGLGKAAMQLRWAAATQRDTGGRVLILAPLAVAQQTEREAAKFGIEGVAAVRHPDDSDAPIVITNYERLHLFNDREWSALVLDESSILKSVDSRTRDELTRWAASIRYRLCCTATPAPNDYTELGNHAEFLGVLTRAQMLGTYFVHDEQNVAVQRWRLKGHAHEAFWRWVAGWAIAARRPSDLGYSDDGYVLPALEVGYEWVGDSREAQDGQLFALEAHTLEERRRARLASTDLRVDARMAFVGLSDSYEQWYQAIRRCWRFGQTRPVQVHVFASDAERVVIQNVQRKAGEAEKMMEQITRYLADARAARSSDSYSREIAEGDGWTLHLGDCLDVAGELEPDSIGLSVFSPPFPGMYVYSDSPRDLGNTYDLREFARSMRVLSRELLTATMPGRTCAIHLCQTTAQKVRDGYVGIKDFRGSVIRTMQRAGWVYYGEVCIDKDPQVKAIRTKDQGLLFKSLARDSSVMHMALADYVLQFRKPGANTVPIAAGVSEKYGNRDGWITQQEWIEWAAPVWYRAGTDYPGGIRETDVLNVARARDERDERHLAPLQLGVIERYVKLWSAPGETVFSPFAGIGSEGVVALQQGRRFIDKLRAVVEADTLNAALALAYEENRRTYYEYGVSLEHGLTNDEPVE